MDKVNIAIRKYLAAALPNDCFLPEQIAKDIEQPALVVRAALIRLVEAELVTAQRIGGELYYSRSAPFVARQIIPLFAGTPDWIVETAEGRLCCWCPSEFDARVIADALSRS